jgi:hypothetical protein
MQSRPSLTSKKGWSKKLAKLTDLGGTTEPKKPVGGQPISGAFTCGECGEIASEAIMNLIERHLTWTCVNDHTNTARL